MRFAARPGFVPTPLAVAGAVYVGSKDGAASAIE